MQQEVIPPSEPMVMPEEQEHQEERIRIESNVLQQPTTTGLKLTRRQSLPASDPFHRIFDQMIQPEVEQVRGATHLIIYRNTTLKC